MRSRDDENREGRLPAVPPTPSETSMIVRQFRQVNRSDQLRGEIARKARTQPAELARLLSRWLHQDD